MQVAYLLNIRGNDVAHCPVAMSYALVTPEGASLFIDRGKLSPNVEQEIKARLRCTVEWHLSCNSMYVFCLVNA